MTDNNSTEIPDNSITNTFILPREVIESFERYKCKMHQRSKVFDHFFPNEKEEKIGYKCPICKEEV